MYNIKSSNGILLFPHYHFHFFNACSGSILNEVGDRQHLCLRPLLTVNPFEISCSLLFCSVTALINDTLIIVFFKSLSKFLLWYTEGFFKIPIEDIYLMVSSPCILYELINRIKVDNDRSTSSEISLSHRFSRWCKEILFLDIIIADVFLLFLSLVVIYDVFHWSGILSPLMHFWQG